MIIRFAFLIAVLAAGCSGPSEPQPEPVPIVLNEPEATEPTGTEGDAPPLETPAAEAEGTPCTSSADCAQGEMCSGPEGCDVTWTCQPAGPCTRDLVTYCGCDGQTIQGSGSCPPAPYSHRGEC